MRMEQLKIRQFRGLKNLNLKRLGDINLLLGDNDSGKTTVLEAVRMFGNTNSIDAIVYGAKGRMPNIQYISRDNYSFLERLMGLFPFMQQEYKEISLCARIDGLDKRLMISGELVHVLRTVSQEEYLGYPRRRKKNTPLSEQDVLTFHGTLRTHENETPIRIDDFYRPDMASKSNKPPCPIEYMAPGDHLSMNYDTKLYRSTRQQESEIVRHLQLIDPEIEGFKLQPNPATGSMNQTIEHRRFGNVPLYTYGDGMKKALSLAAHILDAKDGILLIDEIETSLQASNLRHVFAWLLRACRQLHVQLFATTHSLEAVSALVSCAVETAESNLVCYRLETDNQLTYAKRFSESDLDSMVNGRGIDVR